MSASLQIFLFTIIAGNFIALYAFVVGPIMREAFSKPLKHEPIRHEAVVIQFRPRARKGHFHG